MCVAQQCPVCEGDGSVVITPRYGEVTSIYPPYKTCHGCNGLGWVTVHCIYETTVIVTINGEEIPGTIGEFAPDVVDGRED